jgi:hypothetical protein
VIVTPSGETLLLQDVPYGGAAAMPAPRGALVSDRGVYRRGDELFLHGYLREVRHDGRLALPSGTVRAHVAVSWEAGGGASHSAVSFSGGRGSSFPIEREPEEQVLNIDYDAQHGGFSVRTIVPPTARVGEHQLTLRALLSDGAAGVAGTFVGGGVFETTGGGRTLDTLVVQVADPRPPSVSMTATLAPGAKRVLPPGGKLRLVVQTSTLSGVPVGGARVTMRWRIQPEPDATECPYCISEGGGRGFDGEGGTDGGEAAAELPLSGEEDLIVGAGGTLETEWAPPAGASRPLTLGDSLHLSFEWVGPTREIVTAALDVPVALSEHKLSIVPPSQAELPAIPFGAGLELALSQVAAAGGAPASGTRLRLSLFRLSTEDGTPLSTENGVPQQDTRPAPSPPPLYHGAPWLTDGLPTALPPPETDLLRGQQCEVTTGADGAAAAPPQAACALALLGMGHFLLAACEVAGGDAPTGRGASEAGPAICSGVVVGRSLPQWERAPVGSDYLSNAVSPCLDSTTYASGDMATIRLHNPLSTPLSPLLAWGSVLGQKTLLPPPLPPGDGTITFPIGPECFGGCRVSLQLAAVADADRNSLPGNVPTSPLLDPRAPMLASFHLSAEVLPPGMSLTVSLEPSQEAQLPGGSAGLTIKLKDARTGAPVAGTVALAAVDAAMLQLVPHPPVDVAAQLTPRPGGWYSLTSTYDQLASAPALLSTAFKLRDLLEADPFLHLRWDAHPPSSNSWQQTDAERPAEQTLASNEAELSPMAMRPPVGISLRGMPGAFGGDGVLMMADMAMEAAPQMMAAPQSMATAAGDDRAAASKMMRSAAGGASPAQTGGALRLAPRSHFVTTPLWRPALQIPVSGELFLSWPLPDNTGAFELRAYAASGDAGFGVGTATQHVRRPVSLVASAPRIARVGDSFSCGATVTPAPGVPEGTAVTVSIGLAAPEGSDGDKEAPGGVVAPTAGLAPLILELTSRSLVLHAGDTVEVTFPMRAVALGTARLVVTATVDGAGSSDGDALELTIPVLGQQPAVTVATSRALVASEQVSLWREGVALPPAVPGSGTLTAVFGVGRLPAVLTISRALLRQAMPGGGNPRPDSAAAWLGVLAARAALLPYALPGKGPAAALAGEVTDAVAAAAAALASLTDSRGLHSCSAALRAQTSNPGCDARLTAHALYLLRKLSLGRGMGGWQSGMSALAALKSQWTDALGACLVQESIAAAERRQEAPSLSTLAYARLALGVGWEPYSDGGVPDAVGEALSLSRLSLGVDSLPTAAKAAFALSLLLPSTPNHDDPDWARETQARLPDQATAALRFLASCLRVRGRTAYLSAAAGSNADAGPTASAYALSALSAARAAAARGATLPPELTASIDKLADGLASAASEGGALPVVALALADYDAAAQAADADVALCAMLGAERLEAPSGDALPRGLMRVSTRDPPPPPLVVPWPAPSGLAAPPPPFLVASAGRGEISFALSLDFVPAQLMPDPVSRGVRVERVIQAHDSILRSASGPPLGSVPLGSVVTVTAQLSSDDELHNLDVEIWLPAGLEALDPHADGGFSTESGGVSGASFGSAWAGPSSRMVGGWDGGFGGGCWWYRCTSFQRETWPDRVRFSAAWARAGTHTVSFEAVAVTRGSFRLPPVKASCALEPEVMGLSSAGVFNVTAQDTAPVPPAATAPAGCDPECGAHGRCVAGACECDPGFTGGDCAAPVLPPPPLDASSIGTGGTVAVARGARRSFHVPLAMARQPRFAYAMAWDSELLGDGAVTLDTHATTLPRDGQDTEPDMNPEPGTRPPHLTLTVVAPRVLPSDGCTPVLLAVSDDGMAFSSTPVCVCFHDDAADPSNVIARHAAACTAAETWGPLAGGAPNLFMGAGTALVVLVGLGVLGALYARQRADEAPAEGTPIFGGKAVRSDSPDSPGSQFGAAPVAAAPRAGKGGDLELLRTTTRF